jgi:signal peptidase I
LKKFFAKPIFREILVIVVLTLVIFFLARAAIQTYEVFQTSMEPNFIQGQRVVILKAAYWFGQPQRGDVVIFQAPDGSGEEWIKRIIGLPGDTVRIDNGVVYVNDVQLVEPYMQRYFTYSMSSLVVPPGEFFFLGDNRNVSNDSHRGWFMARDSIIGKAWLVTWPPSDWGSVPAFPLNDQLVFTANSP